jgi:hypothetical protein
VLRGGGCGWGCGCGCKNGWKDLNTEADQNGLKFGLGITAKSSTAAGSKRNIDELGFISWKVDYDQLINRSDDEARIAKYREVMKSAWMKTQFTRCSEYDNPCYGWYHPYYQLVNLRTATCPVSPIP